MGRDRCLLAHALGQKPQQHALAAPPEQVPSCLLFEQLQPEDVALEIVGQSQIIDVQTRVEYFVGFQKGACSTASPREAPQRHSPLATSSRRAITSWSSGMMVVAAIKSVCSMSG